MIIYPMQHLLPRFALKPHSFCMSTSARCPLFPVPGWTGSSCNTAICRSDCDPVGGYCNQPGECLCKLGYTGPTCATGELNVSRFSRLHNFVLTLLHRGTLLKHACDLVACHCDILSKCVTVSQLVVQHRLSKLQGNFDFNQ